MASLNTSMKKIGNDTVNIKFSHPPNKMQSETADFAPVPPPGELDESYAVFDSGLFAPFYTHMTSSTKPEVDKVLQCRQRRSKPRLQI